MAGDLTRGYCSVCRKSGPCELRSVSHIMHFFISAVTLGAWLPVWVMCAISRPKFCRDCGGRAYANSMDAFLHSWRGALLMLSIGFIVLMAFMANNAKF